MKRLLLSLGAVFALLAIAPVAQGQSLRVLVSDENPTGHGKIVKRVFQNTASGYGVEVEVTVYDYASPTDLVDAAIEGGYDIVLRAREPLGSAVINAAETAWEHGIPFVSPHGRNEHIRYEATPAILEEGPIFIGGEDLRGGPDGTYGGNLEVDALAYDGSAAQSYASTTGAAMLCWLYQEGTPEALPRATRWRQARALLHSMGAHYDALPPVPSDLNESENELPENVSTLATWRTYAGAEAVRTEQPDGTIRIEVSGGNHKMKFYDSVGQDFAAGSGFTEANVTNQGEDPFQLSSGLYNRTTVAPGETKKIIIDHGFQAVRRDGIFYRMWAATPSASIDAVFEPIVFVTQQPELSPVYDQPHTDDKGYGLVLATRAGLLGTGQLGPAEQVYAQQQQDRLEQVMGSLPVELSHFDGRADGRDAVLTWKTLSEENSAGFFVERKTGEAPWQTAGSFVEGAGTTQEAQTYTRRVKNLGAGTHVFRLRQVDADGTERVLDQRARVEVRIGDVYVLEAAYPNPFQSQATVEFAVRRAQRVTAVLYDALGQRVRVLHEGDVPVGETIALDLDAGRLASGVYFVHLRGEDFAATESVTLAR